MVSCVVTVLVMFCMCAPFHLSPLPLVHVLSLSLSPSVCFLSVPRWSLCVGGCGRGLQAPAPASLPAQLLLITINSTSLHYVIPVNSERESPRSFSHHSGTLRQGPALALSLGCLVCLSPTSKMHPTCMLCLHLPLFPVWIWISLPARLSLAQSVITRFHLPSPDALPLASLRATLLNTKH